jgi:hypothetical protein
MPGNRKDTRDGGDTMNKPAALFRDAQDPNPATALKALVQG